MAIRFLTLALLLAWLPAPLWARPPLPVPLREVRATPFGAGPYFSWASARCDAEGNAFFLQSLPERRRSDAGGAGSYRPRDVLRVSPDGEQARFEPARQLGFGDLLKARPSRMTLDGEGAIHVLVWVERGHDGEQYAISFDQTGRPRSVLRVPWEEILVLQMEVFDSGKLLLRGRGTGASVDRLSVLSEDGSLEDVIGWPGWPSIDEAGALDLMTRGGDGRIYTFAHERLEDQAVVYAVSPSAVAAPVFRLSAIPLAWRAVGLQAAGGRIAVVYEEGPSVEHARSRSWIAVYQAGVASPEPDALYGPGPGLPLCYAREGSRDLFTFLDGSGSGGLSLVVMEPDPAGRSVVARRESAF